jgi:hypothetical protein
MVLTRRNMFAPLHTVSKRSDAYGPAHWITGGKRRSNNQLWQAGPRAAPQLHLCSEKWLMTDTDSG